ncbi:hypothetical protein HMPREF3193_00117 [Bifidobacterium breve]|nr:hypothetical protein HMPREF1587_00884 [Bifidobacterium breve JCP7499]KWZ86859.1 hypothetical protein HMPREF3193_00117 [Bifidobacterium breve]
MGDLDVVVAMSPFGTLIEYLLVYGCGQAISWKAFRRDLAGACVSRRR